LKAPCTERYARCCERSVAEIISYLLLDYYIHNPFCYNHNLLTGGYVHRC
jgi:hypothetical protein